MTNLSTVLIDKALDALTLRSQAIAQNIANLQSPGYAPVRVSFEDALRRAAEKGAAAVSTTKATVSAHVNPLRLDLELTDANATASRYSALAEVLNREMQLRALVADGGSS